MVLTPCTGPGRLGNLTDMKVAYWSCLLVAVAIMAFGYLGHNVRWLVFVGVAILLVGGALNPKRPFYGLGKQP